MPSFGDLNASLDRELGEPTTENERIRREVRESQASYEGRVAALLEWARQATEQVSQPVSSTMTFAALTQARAAHDEFVKSDYTPHSSEKDQLLAIYNEINEKLKSHDMGEYEVGEMFSPANITKVWGDLDSAIAARLAALDYNSRRFKYDKEAGEHVDWLGEATAQQNTREFVGQSSRDVNAEIEKQAAFASGEKATRSGHRDQLASDIASLRSDSSYTAPAGRSDEDIKKLWADLEAAEASRNAELQRQLEFANRREAFEGKSEALGEKFRLQAQAYDDRSFPEDLEAINALIAGLPAERSKVAAQRGEIDSLRGEYDGINNDFKYIAPIGRSISDVEELYAQIERAIDNRQRALEEKKRMLDDAARAKHFRDNETSIEQLQANLRGWLGRKHHAERLALLREKEELWEKIQAIARGNAVRRRIRDMKSHYAANVDKVIKAQAVVRGHLAREHYKMLTSRDNPPVDTVQRFLYLLDESEKDFDEELELERLKYLVVTNIRENDKREVELNHLDIKIALLIRNRSSLDEIVESTKKYLKQQKKAEAADSNNLKVLDKDARQRLESYQHLFYLLQTEPKYLAKVMTELATKETNIKFLETVVLTLYGYAQNVREEYLLLKLFQNALHEEMLNVTDEQDILRGNPVFIKLVVHYTRGARERQFLRELLQPLVLEVLDRDDLDLDVDPLSIYRMLIREEESRSGEKSTKPYDVSRSQAVESEEVMKIFVKRLKDLRGMTDKFLSAIIASLPRMPYGIRYIARELYAALKIRFPNQTDESVFIKIVGHLIYYRYMNPAIVAPEGFDVIETVITSQQRKNLGEISKMLLQVSVNRLFDDESFHLSALNEFITSANARFMQFFREVSDVPSAEDHFQIDRYDDFLKISKPTVYLAQDEIYRVHALMDEYKESITADESDPLRVILTELGPPPPPSVEGTGHGPEITLTLTNRFSDDGSEEEQRVKTTFVQTKRYCLSILRLQKGKNLREILEAPVTAEQEKLYEMQQEHESSLRRARSTRAGGIKKSESQHDVTQLSLKDLKQKALDNINVLVEAKAVSRENNYQGLLNDIAKDMRNKNRRRIQRRAELIKVRQTLAHLEEKTTYLESQKQSYQDYVNSCIGTMRDKGKKSKRRTVLPFTTQFYHVQKMKREGKVFAFGSYSYTAERLFQKGVLVELEGIPESQRSRVSLTISSDEIGVFNIEGKFLGMSVDQGTEIRLDDLLQKQFDNIQIMNLGIAKVNVNLLIFLINKKFFQQ